MYSNNEKAIIWLSLFDKLTLPKAKALLALYSQPCHIQANLECDKQKIIKIVGEDIYYKMLKTDEALLNSYIQNLTQQNITCLTVASKSFPVKLCTIQDGPIILFAKGNLDLLKQKAVAIVGTRKPTAYGRELATTFAEKLAQSGLVIVSGLASGVDKFAHEAALKCGGKTIAVLGGGFNNIYPAMNTNLAGEIAQRGLLISEYRPNVFATKYTFPVRNRIISGLSEGVFVAEAGQKSGALYTSNYALAEGKLVFAAPANITNQRAAGTNNLLKTKQAMMVCSAEEIIKILGIKIKEEQPASKPVQLTVDEAAIYKALEDKPQTFDELQNITKLPSKNLSSCLTLMQIRGLIKKLPANEYSL